MGSDCTDLSFSPAMAMAITHKEEPISTPKKPKIMPPMIAPIMAAKTVYKEKPQLELDGVAMAFTEGRSVDVGCLV